MRKRIGFIAFVGTLAFAVQGHALTLSLHGASTGISVFSYSVTGTTITINETWSQIGTGFIEFDGLTAGTNYTVVKSITNSTGVDWTRFANELLDPSGNPNDSQDPVVQPTFIPGGFTTSNDFDGLSFAQGSGVSRTSSIFTSVFADELTDARDFLDFFGGSWTAGATGTIEFGLRDNITAGNQPFLLAQRPNQSSRPDVVPEPGTMILLGSGILGLAGYGRKKTFA